MILRLRFHIILLAPISLLFFQVFDHSQDGKRQQTAANVGKHSNDASRLEETIGHIAKDMGERTSQEAQRLLSEAVVSFLADLVRFYFEYLVFFLIYLIPRGVFTYQ